MGKRGTKPTPKAILEMRGSWRAGDNNNQVVAPPGRPRCPAWLDRYAKNIWALLIPQLEYMGVLSTIDRNALARYCQLYARWRDAEKFIKENGLTYENDSEKGGLTIKPYPQVKIASSLADQLLRLEQQYGLTASARTSLVNNNPNDDKNKNTQKEGKEALLRLG